MTEIAPIDITPIVVTFLTIVGGGTIAGLFALRRSNKEADNQQAQATANMVGAADDVVALVRVQLAEQTEHIHRMDERIQTLETAISAWDGWADRVLDILDRAFKMLSEEQKAELLQDVENARSSRPPRYHQFRAKHLIQRDGGT